MNKTNKVNFLDKVPLYQEKLFDLSNSTREAVALAKEFVPFEKFARKGCLDLVFQLNTFLRHFVTILSEIFPHEMFSTDKRSKHIIKNLILYSRFSR